MAGSSSSTQTSSGSSTSTPVQTPQSAWGLQLSELLAALAGNQYNWAMGQFEKGMGITDQNIAQYLELSGRGAGLAQDLLTQYRDTFAPLMEQYVQQAGTYASEGRQRFMAGQAMSTVAQANEAARSEAERKLQSFGINPNSGRYQDLLVSSRIADAAARAGAGTQAALDTADRGRAMTEKAIGFGQNLPGMTVQALQSAYTGLTGAENAILGMLNTGVNLTQSAAPYYNAASGAIKMPSQATQSQQQSRGQSSSVQVQPSGGGGDRSGRGQQQRQPGQQPGGGDARGRGGPSTGMGAPGGPTTGPQIRQNPFFNPGAQVKQIGSGTGEDENQPSPADLPYNMVGNPSAQPYFDENGVLTPFGDPNLINNTPFEQREQVQNWAPEGLPEFSPAGIAGPGDYNVEQNYNPNDPNAWTPASPWTPEPANPDDVWGAAPQQNWTPQEPQQDFSQSEWNGWNDFANNWDQQNNFDMSGYEPQQDFGQYDSFDNYGGYEPSSQEFTEYDNYSGYEPQYTDSYSYEPASNDYDYGGYSDAAAYDNYSYEPADAGAYDYGDYGGDYGDYTYARGGKVKRPPQRPGQQMQPRSGQRPPQRPGQRPPQRPGQRPPQRGVLPTTGGAVSRQASPSRGRVTDDVPARLNAGEFVIPRDVVATKGTEFFKNLIAKSRKVRTGMAGPTPGAQMKPALPNMHRPTFVSRQMGA